MTARKPLSLRQQLAKKRGRRTELRFPFDVAGQKAAAELAAAESAQRIARAVSKDAEVHEQNQQRIADAEKAWLAASFPLRFRGLSEDERDATASHHTVPDLPTPPENPPPEWLAERAAVESAHAEASIQANREWMYEALGVCVVDSDLTAEEWKVELTSLDDGGAPRWSAGDVESLRDAILNTYQSRPALGIPKG